MTYKTIVFLLLPFFLFLYGGIGIMLVNELAGIILEGLAVLTIFSMAYLLYLLHKRLIKELKQSIAPGESCAAEGYVEPNPAILVKK